MATGIIDLDAEEIHKKLEEAGIPQEYLNMDKLNERSQSHKVPLGYLPFELSTKGKLNVPEVVHIRNFTAWELINLSMLNDDLIPEQLIGALNNMIYEDVNVAEFPERVVLEILVKLKANFYNPIIEDFPFPVTRGDIKALEDADKGDLATQIKEGKYTPKINLNLTWLTIDTLEDETKDKVRIKRGKKGDPNYVDAVFYRYTRYGDSVKLKKFVREVFSQEQKKFDDFKRIIDLYEQYSQEGKDILKLPVLPEEDLEAYQKFQLDKISMLTKGQIALTLVSLNGEDFSKKTLKEKIDSLDNRPLIDDSLVKRLAKEIDNLKFGVNPEITIPKNPIRDEEVCKRTITFRVSDILQALPDERPDGYDISYDD